LDACPSSFSPSWLKDFFIGIVVYELNIIYTFSGVMLAVDAVVENLKKMSKPVTTPEEIAQVEL